MATAAGKSKGITGWHVLFAMIAFFGVIIGLDSLFVTFALRTHPGEEVPNSYVLGLQYNQELERKAEQKALGWAAEAGLVEEATTMFVVRMQDKDGAPLTGLHVSALVRMAGSGGDGAALDLVERGPGEYVAPTELKRQGRAIAEITARRSAQGGEVFEAQKTLVLS